MKARLDSPFGSWGGFSNKPEGSTIIHGKLTYNPGKRVELELAENPNGGKSLLDQQTTPSETLYGQLVDGTLVTLSGCSISNSSIQLGFGIGSPTTYHAKHALFGRHISALHQFPVTKYSVELSSLANWTCVSPVKTEKTVAQGKQTGLDFSYRFPDPINVSIPKRLFDLAISYSTNVGYDRTSVKLSWSAVITIVAHDSLTFDEASKTAWQIQNLMSLLIGKPLSVRAVTILPAESGPTGEPSRQLELVYQQLGEYDCRDEPAGGMLVPYDLVKEKFATMVDKWFDRSPQAVLAADVFFASHYTPSPGVDIKFLAMAQAIESYHRSLGIGLYMDQAMYDTAIQNFATLIPNSIKGDHRTALRSRLKWGNEYSLRKRLDQMLSRLPVSVGQRIAGDPAKCIVKITDTRNYYTHYDHSAKARAFDGWDSYIAAERLAILFVANLFHDLGIEDDNLVTVLERSREFSLWLSQPLHL